MEFNTLSGATSEIVSKDKRERLLEKNNFDLRAYLSRDDDNSHPAFDDVLTRTTFDGMNWSRFEVLQGSKVKMALADDSGEFLNIGKIIEEAQQNGGHLFCILRRFTLQYTK